MIRNFVLETAQAPGTNANIVLTGPPQDYTSWRSAFTNGALAFYFVDDGSKAEWGVCTVHWGPPDFISRDIVIGNTNSTQTTEGASRINFQSPVQVYNEIPGTRIPFIHGNIIFSPGAQLDPHSGGVPVGASMDYWGTIAPTGWVFCDGRSLSQAQYPFLFSVIGNTYNTVNNPGFFQVPDCQGAVTYGKDKPAPGGNTGNTRLGPFQSVQMGGSIGDYRLEAHTHPVGVGDPGHVHAVNDTQHFHRMDDPGHVHAYLQTNFVQGAGFAAGNDIAPILATAFTDNGNPRGANIGNPPPFTTSTYSSGAFGPIAVLNALTGVTVQVGTAGTGTGGWGNISPGIICNKIIYAGPVP